MFYVRLRSCILAPKEPRHRHAAFAELLMPGGVLYLSWRVTEGEDVRDPKGRLYAAFDTSFITDAIDGLDIKLDKRIVSASS